MEPILSNNGVLNMLLSYVTYKARHGTRQLKMGLVCFSAKFCGIWTLL